MTAQDLIDYLSGQSRVLHAHYTPEQHTLWCLGFLAAIAAEKNHMDTIIWARVWGRIRELQGERNPVD
jgi:hypothetical protein